MADFTSYKTVVFTGNGEPVGHRASNMPDEHEGIWRGRTTSQGSISTKDSDSATLIIPDPHQVTEEPVRTR